MEQITRTYIRFCGLVSRLLTLRHDGRSRGAGLLALFTLLILPQYIYSAEVQAPYFSYEGRLFHVDGTTPLAENVTFRLGIYNINITGNPLNDCLLYEEVQSGVNLTSTSGVFAITIGSVVGSSKRSTNDPGLTLNEVFQNNHAITASVANCPAGTYTPSAGDGRRLRVTVTPQSTGAPETLSPDLAMGSVPSAMVAETVQGYAPSSFVLKDPTTNVLTNELILKSWTTGTRPASPTVGATGFNTTTGYTETYAGVGPGWVDYSIGGGGGSVNSVSATAPITNTGTATNPVLAMVVADATHNGYLSSVDWNAFNGKVASVSAGTGTTIGGTATAPTVSVSYGTAAGSALEGNQALSGDVSGTVGSTSVDKIKGKTVTLTAPADGDVLTYSGGAFINQAPTAAPVTSVFGRTGVVVAASNDYSFSQISGSVADAQLSANIPLKNTTNTFSATNTFSVTGANSVAITGAPAASATSSLLQMGSAVVGGSANGTFQSINAAAGYTGDFANFEVNGVSMFRVDATGRVTASGTPTAASTDIATTNYVDSAITTAGGSFLKKDGSVALTAAWDTGNQAIKNISTLSVGTSTVPTGGVATFNGNVGIGTTSPSYRLHVPWVTGDSVTTMYVGSTNASNNQTAIEGHSYSNYGVAGVSTSSNGVYGASTSGLGVVGLSSSNYGIYGASTSSTGVLGSSTSGTGVVGQSTSGSSGAFISAAAGNTVATLITQQQGASTANLFEAQNAGGTALVKITSAGMVGVGVATPSANLDVAGQMHSQVYSNGASTAIDWNNGNIQTTSAACSGVGTQFSFTNMLEGGSYTLIVTGTATGTCNFSNAGSTSVSPAGVTGWAFMPANSTAPAGTAVYTMLRAGNVVYVSWIGGFPTPN